MFSNTLSTWQWLLFAAVPPAIIALYFLKLRRRTVDVPSTLLWRRAVEDLRVNSLWQRWRYNLLLLLQLLAVGLLMLACLGPGWNRGQFTEGRVIVMIDNSASMSAKDVAPNRLAAAKQQAETLLDQLPPGQAAMLISFSDQAVVEQPFTNDLRRVRERLRQIQPTQRLSDIREALRVAAGLANPGRSATDAGDVQVADPVPADVLIFSDGNYRDTPDFSWGNLRPTYVPVGSADVDNLAVIGFGATRRLDRSERMQAFVQVANYGQRERALELSIRHDDQLLDASAPPLPPGATRMVDLEFPAITGGVLTARIENSDALPLDNVAYLVLEPPRRANILLVSDGCDSLQRVLQTDDLKQRADLTIRSTSTLPSVNDPPEGSDLGWDLVIFDRCQPAELPQAHTLFLGALPPGAGWQRKEMASPPLVTDLDVSHPACRYLEFGDVSIARAFQVIGPPGRQVLIDTDLGPLAVIAPRDGWEDLVLGFAIVDTDESGNVVPNTDWTIRLSFPVFFRNLVDYALSMQGSQLAVDQPGATVTIPRTRGKPVAVLSPSGRESPLADRQPLLFQQTEETGVYRVVEETPGPSSLRFAVNLFSPMESNLAPRPSLTTTWSEVAGTPELKMQRYEAWPLLVLLAIVLLLAEWIAYQQRTFPVFRQPMGR